MKHNHKQSNGKPMKVAVYCQMIKGRQIDYPSSIGEQVATCLDFILQAGGECSSDCIVIEGSGGFYEAE